MDEKTSEYGLAINAQKGDKAALEQLLHLLRTPLFALAYAEVGNYHDAQDAVANGILRICKQISGLQKPESARAWMFRIVQNEARRLRDKRVLASAVDENTGGPWEQDSVILRADIENALRELPREQAQAVSLFYLQGLPVRDIAARLKRPEGTIKYWLHQGRQNLSHEMEGYVFMNPTPTPLVLTATIVSTDFAPDLLAAMTHALTTAGWNDVRTRRDFADLGKQPPAEGEKAPPHELWNSKLLVLDEWINGRSAFEYLPLLRGRKDTKGTAIFLLVNGGQDEKTANITVVSAYVSGVDMLLTKPFNIAEFESFARRICEGVQKDN